MGGGVGVGWFEESWEERGKCEEVREWRVFMGGGEKE